MKEAPTAFNYRASKAVKERTIGIAVTTEQRAEIQGAMRQAGFYYPSEGMRAMMLGFARDAKVRNALLDWLKTQPPHYDR